jgi:hypothetical protein
MARRVTWSMQTIPGVLACLEHISFFQKAIDNNIRRQQFCGARMRHNGQARLLSKRLDARNMVPMMVR